MENEIGRMVDDYDRGSISRRELIARVTGLAGAAVLAPVVTGAQSTVAPTFRGTDVNHIALRVTDIERSTSFYQRHLGLSVASKGESSAFLRCREHNFLALFRANKPAMDHYCFSISRYDPADAVTRLEAAGLKPRRRGDRVYFDDPDGLEVQVAAKTHNV